jgi:hypothetical protein
MSATRKRRTGLRDEEPLLGAHVSTAGGVACAIDRARAIGCTAMQIFVKNNMQWFAKPLECFLYLAVRQLVNRMPDKADLHFRTNVGQIVPQNAQS